MATLHVVLPRPVMAACPQDDVMILLSSDFWPYVTAADSLEQELKTRCPAIHIRRLYLDQLKTVTQKAERRQTAPSLVFPIGTEAVVAAQKRFPAIPIVFSMVLDPSPSLLAGQNIYGVVLDIPCQEIWKQLKSIAPHVSRPGILYTDDSWGTARNMANILRENGINPVLIKIDSSEQIQHGIEDILRLSDALIAIPDTNIYNKIVAPRIIFEAIRHRKPFVGLSKNFTESGALLSVDSDYEDIGIQAADMGLDILSGNVPASRIQFPRKFSTSLNLHTARLIGLVPGSETIKAFNIVAY